MHGSIVFRNTDTRRTVLGCGRKCISWSRRPRQVNGRGRVTLARPPSLCDCLRRALGTRAPPRPCDRGIDFRISSVTLLDPEKDRGPLCYSPCSRNATDLSFLFQMLLILLTQKAPFCPGKQACSGAGFWAQLPHSQRSLDTQIRSDLPLCWVFLFFSFLSFSFLFSF